ncbi:hypothetical protein J1614_012235 [Plenodomus biglobosus]|nr:hypothetical protein J1614_012235 [Plenodomus biglobosus]
MFCLFSFSGYIPFYQINATLHPTFPPPTTQILEALGVDNIDESEVLTPADVTSRNTPSASPWSSGAATSAKPKSGW